MNVCIVGSSSILSKYKLGRIIDRMDTVCRINDFRVKNFESVVGHNTTFACIHSFHPGVISGIEIESFVKSDFYLFTAFTGSEVDCEDNKKKVVTEFNKKLDLNIPREKVSFFNDVQHIALKQKLLSFAESEVELENFNKTAPSSGIKTIDFMNERFPNEQLFICGFDPLKKHPWSHYWDAGNVHDNYMHPLVLEYRYIRFLIEEGRIVNLTPI